MKSETAFPDWADDVEKYWQATGNTKYDLLKLIRYVENVSGQVDETFMYVRDQRTRILDILNNLAQLYKLRFQEELPPRTERDTPELTMLDTPEERSEAIREAALAIAMPGSDASIAAVLTFLSDHGMRIVASNPRATIASVLYQFSSEFERVQGRRGVFRRREQDQE